MRVQNILSFSVLAVTALVGMSACASTPEFDPDNIPPESVDGVYGVLIAPLQPEGGADARFANQLAGALRSAVDTFPSYRAMDEGLVRGAAAYYDVDYNNLSCINAMQLAERIRARLAVCGTYSQGADGLVIDPQVVGAGGDATFDIDPFTGSSPQQAASHIIQTFSDFVAGLRSLTFCAEYLSSEDYETALQHCETALDIDPRSTTGLYQHAQALQGLERHEEAYESLEQLLEVDPLHENAHYLAGIVATHLERDRVAIEHFESYLELNPGNVDIRLRLAQDVAQAGNPFAAYQMLQEGIDADTTGNLTLREYAGHFALAAAVQPEREAESNALYRTALGYYEDVVEGRGDEVEPRMLRNMVSVLIQLEQYDRAVSVAEDAIAMLEEEDSQLLFTYAQALQQQGRTREAVTAVNRAIDAGLDPVRAYTRLAEWLAQEGQLGQVREVLTAARGSGVELDPIARQIFGIGHSSYYQRGQRAAAVPYFEIAREFATTPVTRGMASFWLGYRLYTDADEATQGGQNRDVSAARQALPMLRSALEYFGRSDTAAYAQTEESINLSALVNRTEQLISIQEAIIRRAG
jgi:tetratricopeptide (TPR) repeat protein